MNEHEIYERINTSVKLDQAKYMIAKQFLLSAVINVRIIDILNILNRFLATNEAITPSIIVINPQWDSTAEIQKAILSITYKACFCEAVYSLIHSGFFLPDGDLISVETHISNTTIRPGYREGGSSGGWYFQDWVFKIPGRLRVSGFVQEADSVIAVPDIFLKQLNIPNLHSTVQDALYDAVRCFRAELYTPCLAMLMKATEGAWTELGLSLINFLPQELQIKHGKLKDSIISPYSSAAKIIKEVVELYEKQDLYGELRKKSGVNTEKIRDVSEWSNRVRENRNAVHYGVSLDFPNNYEKVATMLLGVPTHFKTIYGLIASCNQMPNA
ncbi:MAG TPA: hypothetical protein PKD23_01860 [Bellilinea sp.]|nr:hypothetical protein [Bellilinea sp.]